MGLTNMIFTLAEYLRPLLIRVFPYKLLRIVKRWLVQRYLKNLVKKPKNPFRRDKYPDGINLIGNIKADTGLGQSCRLVAYELRAGNIPFSIYQYYQMASISNSNTEFDGMLVEKPCYNINLIHINPHEFAVAYTRENRSLWDGRYNIGFWLWELEEFPDEWLPCLECLDEVWTPSEFTSRAIRGKTDKPVITVPYYVNAEIGRSYNRQELGLPENQFLFLMMYDRNSMTERKNPIGVLKAYHEAFSGQEDVGLVIKINNCDQKELQDLKNDLREYRNIHFITDTLTRDQVNSLIREVNVLVSLHRAEGFGLVMAEAMLLGTPVIATNWSSNTEFMDERVACLVDYQLVELKKDIGVFKKGNRWADPDIGQAAFYMRRLYEDEDLRRRLSENAQNYIRDKLSMDRAVSIIENRVKEIYEDMAS